MDRYPLQDARRFIVKAFMRLEKVRGIHLALLDLKYTDLMGWDFIKATMWDKDNEISYESMLNEFIFTREDTMSNLDIAAGIQDRHDLSLEDRTILRVAYTLWKDWKIAKKDVN